MTNLETDIASPGITEANMAHAQPTITGFRPSAQPLSFTANAIAGQLVAGGANCYNSDGGSFSFDVAVSHTATAHAVAVNPPSRAQIAASGAITATVRTAEGTSVSDPTLVLRLVGSAADESHPASA